MTVRSRRSVLLAAAGVALGFIAFGRRLRWPGFYGGELEAAPVSDERVPTERPVPVGDERIDDVGPVQEAIRRAGVGSGLVTVSRSEYRAVASALETLPYAEPDDERRPAGRPGVYVADDEYTYRLVLAPYCGRLLDARSGEFSGNRSPCIGR